MLVCALALVVFALPREGGGQEPSRSEPLTALEYHRTWRAAEALLSRGNWSAAVPIYEHLVASFGEDGESWRCLALGHVRLGQTAQAIAAFERSLELGSWNTANLQLDLAGCYARTGDPDAAFARIDAALSARLENRASILSVPDLSRMNADPRWLEVTGSLPAGDWGHVEGWRFDLDYLVREAQRLHVGPGRPAFSRPFTEAVAQLRAEIPELTDDEILFRLMGLLARLNDGHSAIYGPGSDTRLEFERRALPFKFYSFPEGLFVVDGAGEWADHAGSRVLRMGGVTVEDVLRRMAPYRGVDNAMTWTWMGPQFYLRQLGLLRAVGVESSAGAVEVTLRTPEGEELTLAVAAGDFDLIRKLRPSPAAFGDVPRYLRAVGSNYWMEPLPDQAALYVQFNQVRDASHETIAAFAERMRASLAEKDVTNLIVDVRHNNGGNNSLVRPLIRAMVEFEMSSPEHRIFVLMGRNTFSAAQNFINRVERWTDAVFVGEPSSSSPNFVGEETELVLPYSRVRGSISTRYWQDSDPGDERAWIAPRVPVVLSAGDYFDNVDPALDAVLSVIADS